MNNFPLPRTQLPEEPGYTLLTGATGLVGNYLLRDLLLRDQPLAVVVRPGRKLSAEERVETILQRWENSVGTSLSRPVVLAGDITEPHFGLGADDQKWVQHHCRRMVHNAAILKFHGQDMQEEPWRTNLGGTRHALEMARLAGIREFHYVSTAYVAGVRDGIVYEDELECGQEFRNDYEKSKFRAELLVQSMEDIPNRTIYRPAVIVGDSETGFTTSYHGLYLYLRLLATLVPQQERDEKGRYMTPIHLPMRGDEPRNLVPVDWVSSVISHLISTPASHGRTYHLVPDRCTTAREVIDACYRYFNSDGVVYSGESSGRTADNEFAARFFENARVYESYETSDPRFDHRNLKRFAGQLPCPRVDEEMIIRFMEFGVADNWGKRREKPPRVDSWFNDRVDDVVGGARQVDLTPLSRSADRPVRVGVDVRGPGGGQWQVVSRNGQLSLLRGLPADTEPTIQISMDSLQDSRANSAAFWASQFRQLLNDR